MPSNVRFNESELSPLGFSLLGLNGRALAAYAANSAVIIGRNAKADLGGNINLDTVTTLTGSLSADTDNWTNYTHVDFMTRLDGLKEVLFPDESFHKLVISGDLPNRYRWARFQDMTLDEQRPVFKLPFQQLTIEFENLEPYWRETAATIISSDTSIAVPNVNRETLPMIQLVLATSVPSVQQLFSWDGLAVVWDGTKVPLVAGDAITIDCENLVVLYTPFGSGVTKDAIRAYASVQTSVVTSSRLNNGFPYVARGGSVVTNLAGHGFTIDYDRLYG